MRTLVLQHIACEPPGVFEDVLVAGGAEITRIELDEGEPIPPLSDHDALIVMGGPMGAYEDDQHPWLADELATVRGAVAAGMPVLGVCLGAQVLARAAGGRAYAGHGAEVGVLPVALTDAAADDPVFGDLPTTFDALQWHGDTFDLPPGAVLLATSDEYPQAFRIGQAYGVQFHVEVTTAMAREWADVPAYAASLDAVLGPRSFPRLLVDFEAGRPAMHRVASTIAERFAELVTDRLQPVPHQRG